MLRAYRSRLGTALSALVAVLMGCSVSLAQLAADGTSAAERANARAAMAQGDAAFAEARIADALLAYSAADRIMRVPTTAFAVGRCDLLLGHLVEAQDALLRAVRFPVMAAESAAFDEARAAAAALVRQLEARLPQVEVLVRPVTARSLVTVDHSPVSIAGRLAVLRLDPGEHTVTFAAPGYQPATSKLSVVDYDRKRISVELARKLGLADVPVATWVAAGTSGAALLVGVVAGALSAADASLVLATCQGSVCDPSLKPTYERAYARARISNLAFATAGFGALAGLLSLTALPSLPAGSVRLDVSAAGDVWLSGSF